MAKLLNVNNYHYRRGGSDVMYLEHAALMDELGWETAFFSMQHPKNQESPWSSYFVDEIEFGKKQSIATNISMAGKVIYSNEAQRKLRLLLKSFHADIAHLHCIYHHLSPSIIPELHKAGVPMVMTAHDLKIACPAYKMLNGGGICERCKDGNFLNVVKYRCVRNSLAASLIVALESTVHKALGTYRNYLDKVVTPSRFFRDKLMEWGWPSEKLAYIPNYVDAEKFNVCYTPGNYFLYFGRLAVEKGVDTLLRAAKKANVPLKIAGTGPYEPELRQLKEELQADAEFLGHCSGSALNELILGARAIVLPSQWYENSPMSILESYASGKPVIGARIGGIPELIDEGQTGWLFESGNVDSLVDALVHIGQMQSSTIAESGHAARNHVQNHFNKEKYIDSTLKLYGELIK
jgi:glycosyltransferase involved in cell wall biosynthesis